MALIEALAESLSVRGLLASVVAGYLLYSFAIRLSQAQRLRKLGGARAQRIRARLPWSLDIIYGTVKATVTHKNYEKWLELFGENASSSYTAEMRPLGRRMVLTADPENIKAILATQFGEFGKGDIFHEEWREFLGDSIFVTDGAMWHTSRQLLRPQFSRDRIGDLHCFEAHLQTLFRAMANGGALRGGAEQEVPSREAANGRVLDISDLFFRYTLDVATDFLLGKDVGSLTDPEQEFAHAFNEVQRIQNIITRAGPIAAVYPRAHFRRCLGVMNEFVNRYVQKALELSPAELESKAKSDQSYTFLHELASYTRDPKVLRDQLVAVLLAGRDTTAASLSWTIYELGRHPEVVRKLRREIMAVVGSEAEGATPTYANLKDMKYLQHVMQEVLRLYPVVPFNVRFALQDTTLPRGGGPDGSLPLPVLKDTPVGYSTMVMQRRRDLYPSSMEHDVDKFWPERWEQWQPKPWQYVPFNGGPRICIGQQFALTEMGYVLARLFQRFERVESFMDEIDGGQPTLKAEIVLQPGDGVRVAFWEGKSE